MCRSSMNNRPKSHDPEIIASVVEHLTPNVLKWMQAVDPDSETEDFLDTLTEAISSPFTDDDGYKLAKYFDDLDPDEHLVEILSEAGSLRYDATKKACEKWAAENNVQPIPEGTKVRRKGHADYGIGEVIDSYPDARQCVCFPDKGHGVQRGGQLTHGSIVAVEELEVVIVEDVTKINRVSANNQ